MPGELLVFFAALLWSLIGILVKGVAVSPAWMMVVRSLTASICLLPFLFKPRLRMQKALVLAGVFYTAFCFLFIWAARLGNAAMAISMQYTAPVYLLGYDMIKARKASARQLVPFVLLLAGIGMNVLGAVGQVPPLALLLGLLVGLVFVFYGGFLQKVEGASPFGVISAVNLIALVLCLFVLPFNPAPAPASLQTVLVLILSGLLISALSYVLYRAGLSKIPLERGMLITLSEVLLNPFWVFLFMGEVPPPLTMVALFIILAGAMANILLSRTKPAPPGTQA